MTGVQTCALPIFYNGCISDAHVFCSVEASFGAEANFLSVHEAVLLLLGFVSESVPDFYSSAQLSSLTVQISVMLMSSGGRHCSV